MKQVCVQFVELCRLMGLLTNASVAIDGSKFKAVNTHNKNSTQWEGGATPRPIGKERGAVFCAARYG